VPASEYRPQLATLVKDAPQGDEWLHEIKFDGYRIGCRIRNGRAALISRNGKDWTAAFPDVAVAAAALPVEDALLDGEVAMVLPDGRTSFQALQNASAGNGGTLVYFVFDLLRLDGTWIGDRPIEERKARLRKLVGGRKTGRIRYAEHVEGRGGEFFQQACRLGLEGIISKRRGQPYREGRHGDWLKTKCTLRQEFVIGGFTEPQGMRGRAPHWLLRGRPPAVLRQGRDRIQSSDGPRPEETARHHRAGPSAVRPATLGSARPPRPLGAAGSRLRGGVHRVDERRQDPASVVPGAARRQARRRDRPRAPGASIRRLGSPSNPPPHTCVASRLIPGAAAGRAANG
jgi:DNA ligase D-like protein (predicted ligase)